MSQANLSETLFKPRFKHPETSTLVRRSHSNITSAVHSALDGDTVPHWYRMINRLLWIWRGVDPRDILDVQARIACTQSERTNDELLDTVIGYRGGNWIYEWSKQAMLWQQRACKEQDEEKIGQYWLKAANLYSIAAYPHIKGMLWQNKLRFWLTVLMKKRLHACLEDCVNCHFLLRMAVL